MLNHLLDKSYLSSLIKEQINNMKKGQTVFTVYDVAELLITHIKVNPSLNSSKKFQESLILKIPYKNIIKIINGILVDIIDNTYNYNRTLTILDTQNNISAFVYHPITKKYTEHPLIKKS
ncbi:MAG: hypothetical protein WC942_08655 [Clostridia bacterium]|jgi:sporulation protein YlmC with PRC-barrel domain